MKISFEKTYDERNSPKPSNIHPFKESDKIRMRMNNQNK